MTIPVADKIFYPDRDGKPIAETGIHVQELIYGWQALRERFEDEPNVFVGANLFLYYREGDPSAVVTPDNFVVRGVPKRLEGDRGRRNFLLWEEGKVPCFVLEITSKSTRIEDIRKKETYEKLGVEEFFRFDPLGEYLNPTLQGFQLVDGRYHPLSPNPDGSILSETIGVVFSAEGSRLRLIEAVSGAPYLRSEEIREARRQAEEARRQAEERAAAHTKARLEAEEKIRALEQELQRLRNPR